MTIPSPRRVLHAALSNVHDPWDEPTVAALVGQRPALHDGGHAAQSLASMYARVTVVSAALDDSLVRLELRVDASRRNLSTTVGHPGDPLTVGAGYVRETPTRVRLLDLIAEEELAA